MLRGSVWLSHDPHETDSATMCRSGCWAYELASTSSSTLANTSLKPASVFGAKYACWLADGAVDRIDFPAGFCRRDIGYLAVAREKDR